jgi:hypothetical protein
MSAGIWVCLKYWLNIVSPMEYALAMAESTCCLDPNLYTHVYPS